MPPGSDAQIKNNDGRKRGEILIWHASSLDGIAPTSFHYYLVAQIFSALWTQLPTPEPVPAKFYGRYAWPCITEEKTQNTETNTSTFLGCRKLTFLYAGTNGQIPPFVQGRPWHFGFQGCRGCWSPPPTWIMSDILSTRGIVTAPRLWMGIGQT